MTHFRESFFKRLAGLILVALHSTLWSHPISMSSVVVDVAPDKILVEMNIMTEDLALYHDLEPGTNNKLSAKDLLAAAEKHQQFLTNYFKVISTKGERLSLKPTQRDTTQIDEEGLYPADLMQFSVLYQFEATFAETQPFLTFSQNFGGDDSSLPTRMDLTVLQTGLWVENPLQLSHGSSHTTAFDWENGPPDAPKNFEQILRHNEILRKKRLGLTSFSSVYSFLHVDPFEARLELLLPLTSFESWIQLTRETPDLITIAEQQSAESHIKSFFATNTISSINGSEVPMELRRLEFYGPETKDLAQRPVPKDHNVYQARMGIIIAFPSSDLIQSLSLDWKTYNRQVQFIKSDVYIAGEPDEKFYFEPGMDGFKWENTGQLTPPSFLDVPVPPEPALLQIPLLGLFFLTAACLTFARAATADKGPTSRKPRIAIAITFGLISLFAWPHGQKFIRHPFLLPKMPDESQQKDIARSLMANLYSAFDYRDESTIYDALDRSLSPSILRDLYLRLNNSLSVEEQGGARSQISDIDWETIQPARSSAKQIAFSVDTTWSVQGSVEHWGHRHERRNQYQATVRIGKEADQWKIQSLKVKKHERTPIKTDLAD